MKRSILLIFSVTIIAFIAACDSGGGGGSERFSTVEVFASYDEADTIPPTPSYGRTQMVTVFVMLRWFHGR